MASEPLHVFIDTSTYEELGFHSVQTGVFDKLREHVAAGRAVLHVTTVTRREVDERIRQNAEQAERALKEARNKARRVGVPVQGESVSPSEALGLFREFLDQCKPLEHSVSGIDAEEVFDLFFNKRPPFSTKKRTEFPDAFAALALRDWADQEQSELLVVADDGDWSQFCDTTPRLTSMKLAAVVARLEELATPARTLARARRVIEGALPAVRRAVASSVEDMFAVLEDRWDHHAEVEAFHVVEVEGGEFDIIEADPGEGLEIVLYCVVSLLADVRYGDEDTMHYDSESGDHFYREVVEQRLERTANLECRIEFEWDGRGEPDLLEVDNGLGDCLYLSVDGGEAPMGRFQPSSPPQLDGLKLSEKMEAALGLLAEHSLVLVSTSPPGRYFGPAQAIHPSVARALEQRGLASIEFQGGKPGRDRGLNQNYASITEAGRKAVKQLGEPGEQLE